MNLLKLRIIIIFLFPFMQINAQWQFTTFFSDDLVDNILVLNNDIYAGIKTDACDIFKSSDNGTTWNSSSSGITYKCTYETATDGTNIYAGTWNSGVCKSTNNGTTWTPVNNGITYPAIMALACSGQELWAGAFNGEMYYSNNGGSNWTSKGILTSIAGDILIRPGRIIHGGSKGTLVSTDNGATWTNTSNGFTDSTVMCLLADGSYIFAGTWGGGLYRSSDEGNTWTPVNNGLINNAIFDLVKSGNTIFAATMGSGVFMSNDHGNSWTAFNTGLIANFPAYSIAANSTYLFVGGHGTGGGVWRRPLSDVSSADSKESSPEISLFPNPAADEIIIEINIPVEKSLSACIYNVPGKAVMEIPVISNSENIDVSILPKGTYIINIYDDSTILFHSIFIKE